MTTFTVTTLSDSATHSGVSLRDALDMANADSDADVIVFDDGLDGTITLTQGELTISSDVSIDGDVGFDKIADITISANSSSRIFNVEAGTSKLDALILRDGVANAGGAILITNGANLTVDHSTITSNQTVAGALNSSRGGGIANFGNLTIQNTTIEKNVAFEHGGAINNGGVLSIINSTFSNNSAGAFGGAILSDGVSVKATNTTFSGNSARYGGAIVNEVLFDATHITVTGNTADLYGAGIVNVATFNLSNSIVLGNGPTSDIGGTISVYGGLNIVGVGADTDAADGVINAASVSAVFGAAALADYGGAIQTIMLAANANPAVDAAVGNDIPATDARGFLRSGRADLGAVERGAAQSPDPIPTPDPGPVPGPVALNVIKGSRESDKLRGLADDDAIYAYSGNDIVHGSDGDDSLFGGGGNDRLYGNDGKDTVLGSSGTDSIYGGRGRDVLSGQTGNDSINGGLDNDRLAGGTGDDRFVFDNLSSQDTIADFRVKHDRIVLIQNVFKGLDAGKLESSEFVRSSSARDAADRIIYDTATGHVSFDQDGTGAIGAVTFAKISTGLSLTASDFLVI